MKKADVINKYNKSQKFGYKKPFEGYGSSCDFNIIK